MTAQIGDIYKYKNKEYSIVAMSSPINFKPEDMDWNLSLGVQHAGMDIGVNIILRMIDCC